MINLDTWGLQKAYNFMWAIANIFLSGISKGAMKSTCIPKETENSLGNKWECVVQKQIKLDFINWEHATS